MLGKRPRPILRTTSKSQLMPTESPPAQSKEPKVPPTPVPGAPRLVIGFNPVSQKVDCEGSPRSVMEPKALAGIAKVASQERSPRSPKSGLESLLSSPRPGNVQGSDKFALATAVTKEGGTAKGACVEVVEAPVVLFTEVFSFKCCAARFPATSQPIPIAPTHLQSSSRGKTQLGKAVQEDEHEASAQRREGLRNQTRGVFVGWDDEDVGKQESIFSTASPASSCNENVGDFSLSDFLNACFFCKRSLVPGEDIFMYRGDRAFCTAECRYKQIVIDERKERCASATHKAGAAVSSDTKFRSNVLAATTAAAA